MRIKKKTATRWASLSALGAGALGLAAGTAEASPVSVTFATPLGIGPGQYQFINIPTASASANPFQIVVGNSGGFGSQQNENGAQSFHWLGLAADPFESSSQNLVFARTSSGTFLRMFKASQIQSILQSSRPIMFPFTNIANGAAIGSGQVFQHVTQSMTTSQGGKRPVFKSGNTTGGAEAYQTFQNEFAIFAFHGQNSSTQYGWLELNVSSNAPFVQLDGYGYTGAPEPGTMSLSALAALALGAAGTRRWRRRAAR
jgi:hypothetical protein